MKKIVLTVLFLITLILAACSQGEEDTGGFSGVISDGDVLGYEYTVTKKQDAFFWEVGYKGNTSIIQESQENEKDLDIFMRAVGDSQSEFVKLVLSLSYLFISVVLTLFLYKRNKKVLKESGPFIAVFAGVAIYVALGASLDLNSSLQDAKYYYYNLMN
ncbi:hypothetical protein [Bacillus sp. AK031]